MWKIEKIVSKGQYKYAVVKNHPKRTKNRYVLLHRIIMENYLGRLLEDNEVVHHIDYNKLNNKIPNLELMLRIEHIKLHMNDTTRKYVILKCPWCNNEFEIPHNNSFLSKKGKYSCTCCSNSCRGKLYSFIQNKGLTPQIQKQINECLIQEFRK